MCKIAKIKFNRDTPPEDIERAIEELQIKVAGAESKDAVDLYRRMALCAILLADAAENGKW